MAKVYIIVQGMGAYSERIERPARAYLDREKAQEIVTQLKAIHKTLVPPRGTWKWDWEKANPGIVAAAMRAYAVLGFEDDPYGYGGWKLADSDWELAECELAP